MEANEMESRARAIRAQGVNWVVNVLLYPLYLSLDSASP